MWLWLLLCHLLVLSDLTWRTVHVAVKVGHASHIEGLEASHDTLPVILILPHLRVVLRELAL